MLKLLEKELPKLWTDEFYGKRFLESPSTYKDFDHALKHVLKAAVKLQNMVEEADHDTAFFPISEMEKYLADLVISTVRAALKAPGGSIDLEKAIVGRIESKMGVKLDNDLLVFVPKKHDGSFISWLSMQKKRPDSIGDLARDFLAGSCCKKECNNATNLRKHMILEHDPVKGALDALSRAESEWMESGKL